MRRALGGGGGAERGGGGAEREGTGARGAGGEGYTEPSYMTRQRCLVLNDWALNLFAAGEHRKVTSFRRKKIQDGTDVKFWWPSG